MLLYLVRHGDPIYNPDSLTPLGERQAEAIGRRLALHGIDKIYESSSERAKLTAKPACQLLHLQPTVLDWCNESHAWDEFTRFYADGSRRWIFQDAELRRILASPEVAAMGHDWYKHPAFDGERCKAGLDRFRLEVTGFCSELGYDWDEATRTYRCTQPNDGRIALFAHQGFSIAFLSCLLDVPYPSFATHFDVSHSCMNVIGFRDEGGYCIPCLMQLSNDSHLYAEHLPTRYQNEIYI